MLISNSRPIEEELAGLEAGTELLRVHERLWRRESLCVRDEVGEILVGPDMSQAREADLRPGGPTPRRDIAFEPHRVAGLIEARAPLNLAPVDASAHGARSFSRLRPGNRVDVDDAGELVGGQTPNALLARIATPVSRGATLARSLPPAGEAKEAVAKLRKSHPRSVVGDDDRAAPLRSEPLPIDGHHARIGVVGVLHELKQRGRIPSHQELAELAKELGVDRKGRLLGCALRARCVCSHIG